MRKIVVLVSFFLINWQQQKEITLDIDISLKKTDECYTFEVSGETNLPDETILKISVYHPEETNTPEGIHIFKDYLKVVSNDYNELATVQNGSFQVQVYRLPKRPFSLKYRAEVTFDKSSQKEAILLKLSIIESFSRTKDLIYGNEQELESELQASAIQIEQDFKALHNLFINVKKTFESHKHDYKPEAWREFSNDITLKTLRIQKSNEQRYDLWNVWIERKAKMIIATLCETLEKFLKQCELSLRNPSNEKLEELYNLIQDFQRTFDTHLEELGFDRPDKEKIKPLIESLEKSLEELDRIIMQNQTDQWNKFKEKEFPKIFQNLSEMTQVATKKGHNYIERIAKELSDLVRLNLSDESIRNSLEKLLSYVKELKDFSDLR